MQAFAVRFAPGVKRAAAPFQRRNASLNLAEEQGAREHAALDAKARQRECGAMEPRVGQERQFAHQGCARVESQRLLVQMHAEQFGAGGEDPGRKRAEVQRRQGEAQLHAQSVGRGPG